MYALQEDCDELAVFVFQCSTVYKYLFHSKRFSTPDTRDGGGAYRIVRLRRPSADGLSLILTFYGNVKYAVLYFYIEKC